VKRFFKGLKGSYLALILLFLYSPIAIMIAFSFNAGKSRAKWEGFSFRWYEELFKDPNIMNSLVITLAIAVLAALFATIIGTLAAIGIHAMKRRPQQLMLTLNNIPMTMPDIVTGISLMLLFIFTQVERGFVTMLLAHITFDVPYVILSIMPKLKQMNKNTYEAALDLGATPMYALFHVILPQVMPGVITGAMLAFTLSLDDFTISYFTTSPLVQNLSTLIYSQARKGIKPTMNALSALMFVALLLLLLVVNKRTAEEE
jgi:spermidine/putrescine transport system permease protein